MAVAPSKGLAQDRDLMNVRVGFQGRPSSIRKVPRNRLKPGHINRMFDCDVEFLVVRECVSVSIILSLSFCLCLSVSPSLCLCISAGVRVWGREGVYGRCGTMMGCTLQRGLKFRASLSVYHVDAIYCSSRCPPPTGLCHTRRAGT